MMKKTLLLIKAFLVLQFVQAQKATGIKTIPIDSLKKYHLKIVTADSSKNVIHLSNKRIPDWAKMNIWEKLVFLSKGVYDSHPILVWVFGILLVLWILKQIKKVF
jgi:hypothetical protein